jgi:hypothetical protein
VYTGKTLFGLLSNLGKLLVDSLLETIISSREEVRPSTCSYSLAAG